MRSERGYCWLPRHCYIICVNLMYKFQHKLMLQTGNVNHLYVCQTHSVIRMIHLKSCASRHYTIHYMLRTHTHTHTHTYINLQYKTSSNNDWQHTVTIVAITFPVLVYQLLMTHNMPPFDKADWIVSLFVLVIEIYLTFPQQPTVP